MSNLDWAAGWMAITKAHDWGKKYGICEAELAKVENAFWNACPFKHEDRPVEAAERQQAV